MTSTDPTAWAIYGRKTGALRYVVGGDLDIPALSKHYDVVPLYPAPTPPADDVRESLAQAWQLGFAAGFIDRHRALPDENGDYGATLPLPNPYGEGPRARDGHRRRGGRLDSRH